MGAQGLGKIAKWKFGEYAVVASKAGWVKTTSKSNLFNTKTESKKTQKFSFTMCNQAGDSALVNAAMQKGHKQYVHMNGLLALRESMAEKIKEL